MKLTIIHPAVGKVPGKKYIRAWQMEPLSVAQLAALTPDNIDISFWDDRIESIPYEQPADLVAMSIETYTAKRAYQIATTYRQLGIPVVMGGFHATLCPDEVSEYADSIVIGEAESVWAQLLADFRKDDLKPRYMGQPQLDVSEVIPRRDVYRDKDYVKISLLEAGRGCRFKCDFCSIHNYFKKQHSIRRADIVIREIRQLKGRSKLFFFVDDNITSDQAYAADLFRRMVSLKIKWVGQADISIARNPELLELMVKSGCQGILIGIESLKTNNLKLMNKSFMPDKTELESVIRTLHRAGLRIYATFLFGYEEDTVRDFETVLRFCIRRKVFMVGFNILTPFPGTALYKRLERKKLLLYDKWWLDERFTYGQIPIKTNLKQALIETECRRIRKKFYSFSSILYRMFNWCNVNSLLMLIFYLSINNLLRRDTHLRKNFPLGDRSFSAPLMKTKK